MQRAILFFRTVGLFQHTNQLIKLRGITPASTQFKLPTSNLGSISLLTSESQQVLSHSQSPQFSTTADLRSISRMGDAQSTATDLPESNSVERPNKIRLSEEQWKSRLTDEQFYVCRKKGTERAWTGDLLENKGPGTYQCSACGADLFTSTTKFDSGSGWPSFYDVVRNQDNVPAVEVHVDRSHGMTRTEVLCGQCDSHLGHVFNDGPKPTGLRYCINSVSLKFKPAPSKP